MKHLRIRPIRREDAISINKIRRQPSVINHTMSFSSERMSATEAYIESLGTDEHSSL
ncbi:hypothetical protein [Cytobacillus purgationiresistens]|uniref:GNAT family N-acetyltransferase n=1 Tax=Cytobacillus purgationiresistens TaxID=863449 RepID=A0ABU0AP83_9BACI|nr:hypothetical protein [Cytobacillus purgationiresistens]MDQ0272674.1 hypothetical protein [Cytobacillus purgationiresistens]